MGLLKKILKKRRELRLIISSATVDAEYIRDFFGKGAILSIHNNNKNDYVWRFKGFKIEGINQFSGIST